MLHSRSVVRRIIEEKGRFMVSFTDHDGYFYLEDPTLQQIVRDAEAGQREIFFTYDPALNILSVR